MSLPLVGRAEFVCGRRTLSETLKTEIARRGLGSKTGVRRIAIDSLHVPAVQLALPGILRLFQTREISKGRAEGQSQHELWRELGFKGGRRRWRSQQHGDTDNEQNPVSKHAHGRSHLTDRDVRVSARSEGRAKACDQFALSERFHEIASHAGIVRITPNALVEVSSDQYCRNRLTRCRELPVQVQTAQYRHLHIGYDTGNFVPASRRQKLAGGRKRDCRVAKRSNQGANGLAHRLVVVDNRDKGFC
jgi:hypothetical protein